MTEKEKAQAGLLYKSTEEELKSELMRCKNLCAEYNRLMPSQSEERKAKHRSETAPGGPPRSGPP